jgi:hypothetical protein
LSPGRVKNFLHVAQTVLGPTNLLYNEYRGLFPGGKAVGAWSSPLTVSAEVKKVWIDTSTPPYIILA